MTPIQLAVTQYERIPQSCGFGRTCPVARGRLRKRTQALTAVSMVMVLAACDIGAPARVSAPADSAAGEVAFAMAGPNAAAVLIPVQINGRAPVDFVLDTGATFTCVDASLASELGLPEERGVSGMAFGAMRSGRMQTVRIDTLRVGHAAVYDMLACTLELGQLRDALGASGLLGLNFLKAFAVSIDFERNVLTLLKAD